MQTVCITPQQREIITKNLGTLGKVPKLDNGAITLSESPVRRLINDGRVKLRPRPAELKNTSAFNQLYFGIGYREAISTFLQTDYELYTKLFFLADEIDALVSTMVESVSQAAVLVCTSEFGSKVPTHIHQQCAGGLPTLSVFVNLTHSGFDLPVLTMFEPVFPGSKFYDRGYTDRRLMGLYENRSQSINIKVRDKDVVIFDSQFIPHSFSMTGDIWLAFVYDGVELRNSATFDTGTRLLNSELKYYVFSITDENFSNPVVQLD